VFYDRLIDDTDKENFIALITEKLGLQFDQTYHNICPSKQPPIFGKYLHSEKLLRVDYNLNKIINVQGYFCPRRLT